MDQTLLWPVGLSLLLLVGAYLDASVRRLPNWLAILLVIYGLAHGWAVDGVTQVPWYFVHMLVALIIGMGLFALRIIGGGDAKFYAGAASYFILWDGLQLLLMVSLAGLALVLGWFVLRRLAGKKIGRKTELSDKDKFPYGVAIAAGGILAAFV